MAKTTTINLGGREFAIRELPTKPAEQWRKKLADELTPLTELIQGAPDLMKIELTAERVPVLIEQAKGLALRSLPAVRELVIAYAPELTAERAWLEDNACDSELIEAFVEVLKMAFPFGSLGPMLSKVAKLGQETLATKQK